MIWLILILILIFGVFLAIKGTTKGHKALGYVLIGSTLIFTVIVTLNIGIKTDEEITDNPSIIIEN